ncbi:hypothetical protein D3C86_1853310 [compost metagenome]
MRKNGEASSPFTAMFEAATITKKLKPNNIKPIANLTGMDGLRFLEESDIQRLASTGAKINTKVGWKFWNQLDGTSHPPIILWVWRSAKICREVPACS